MKKNKPTTYGDIRGYVKRVNGEPEDLDLKARLKECRALMAQKNETQADTSLRRLNSGHNTKETETSR